MIWMSEVVDELTCSKGAQMLDLTSIKPAPAPLPSIVDYSKFCTAIIISSVMFPKKSCNSGGERTIIELIRDNWVSAIHGRANREEGSIHGRARREEGAIHGCSCCTQGEDVPPHAPHRPQSLVATPHQSRLTAHCSSSSCVGSSNPTMTIWFLW